MLVLLSLSFFGCDDSAGANVSSQEAGTAIIYSMQAYSLGSTAAIASGGSADGVTYTLVSGVATATFTNYDISALADPYDTMSGTVIYNTNADTLAYNLTLTGGPVVSIVMDISATTVTKLEVNGIDMTGEVTVTVTP